MKEIKTKFISIWRLWESSSGDLRTILTFNKQVEWGWVRPDPNCHLSDRFRSWQTLSLHNIELLSRRERRKVIFMSFLTLTKNCAITNTFHPSMHRYKSTIIEPLIPCLKRQLTKNSCHVRRGRSLLSELLSRIKGV